MRLLGVDGTGIGSGRPDGVAIDCRGSELGNLLRSDADHYGADPAGGDV